jgi:hypothetical protein
VPSDSGSFPADFLSLTLPSGTNLLTTSLERVEVFFFFVTGLETLQILRVEMSTGGSTKSNARSIEAILTIYLSIPSCRSRPRLGLQSLDLPQKESLLLLMI